jgi:hypothetical protein
MSQLKDLVQIIRENPGCVAEIDNDYWVLLRIDPDNNPIDYDVDEDGAEAWDENNILARDGEVIPLGDGGYGSGHSCGGDILQALAAIVGITIKSV